MSGQLTGRHVLAWLGAFFSVMFAANITLIYLALHTLHGSELENPYDASQAFNGRIAEARAQDERGWKADVMTRAEGPGERVMVEFRDRNGAPISDLEVTARFEHPFDAAKDRQTTLASDGLNYEGVATPVAAGPLDPGDRGEPRDGTPVPQRKQVGGSGYGPELKHDAIS